MGREIRKVPKDWKHPRDKRGKYKPMFAEAYEVVLDACIENHRLWQKGEHPDQKDYPEQTSEVKFYADWNGDAPSLEFYNPNKLEEGEASCFQVYENISEGTPISPVFNTLTAVEDWMVKAQSYSRTAARAFCKKGSAPTFSGQVKITSAKKGPVKIETAKKKNRRI